MRITWLSILLVLGAPAAASAHGIVYIDDPEGFEADAPGELVEVPFAGVPDTVTLIPESVILKATPTSVFPPNSIPVGVEFGANGSGGLTVVGPTQTTNNMGPTGFAFVGPQDANESLFIRFFANRVRAVAFRVVTEGATSARITVYQHGGYELNTIDIPDDAYVGVWSDDAQFSTIEISAPAGSTGAHVGIGDLVFYTEGLSSVTSREVEPPGPTCANGGVNVFTGRDEDADGELDLEERQSIDTICNPATASADRPGFCRVSMGNRNKGSAHLWALPLLLIFVWRKRTTS